MHLTDTIIVTSTGLLVDPLDLDKGQLVPQDIAHALSNQCRFSGHVRKFYSVAEHSVRVARWVRKHGGSIEERKWALLHDASEAYLVDMPKPLKSDPYFGKTYRGAEGRAMAVVCHRFGLPVQMPPIVHEGDLALFGAEKRDLMPNVSYWDKWPLPDFAVVPEHKIKPWSPERAKREWLDNFYSLFEEDSSVERRIRSVD